MSAAELVGDLAVLYVELAALPWPKVSRTGTTTRGRFASWYALGDRLFRLAIDTGIAVARAPGTPLDALVDAVQSDEALLLRQLHDALWDGFSYIGYEYGYFYGGQPWDELCWFRSGVTFLAQLAGVTLDDTDIEHNMQHFGIELYEELDIPPGMPTSHWWWFGEGVA